MMPPGDTGLVPQTPPFSYAPTQNPTSVAAILSLVFGILGVVFVLPLIGPIVAVVAGHMARREIERSEGRLGGRGLAMAGLIMGYIMLAFTLLGICAAVGFFVYFASAMSTTRF